MNNLIKINNMFVLIYGHQGWIGRDFITILQKNNIQFVEGKSKLNTMVNIEKELDEIKPTHVISFIGKNNGEKTNNINYFEQEENLYENIKNNLFSPLVIAELCNKHNIHYTYLGTECIDEHLIDQGQYDPHCFSSSYSIVKKFTDMLITLFKQRVLNLQISMYVICEKNVQQIITDITNNNKYSIPISITMLSELLPYVLDMMTNKITGTINLTNPGMITQEEIFTMYKEYVNQSFTWNHFSQEKEQRTILDTDVSLNTLHLTTLYPKIKHIKDSLKECLIHYASGLQHNIQNILSQNTGVCLLITGGCGFIGSNFINYYFSKDKISKLVNLDTMYYCANEKNVHIEIRTSDKYTLIKGNICDANIVDNVLNTYNITHVIHFAGQSHVQNSFDESISFTKDNILGTHTLLESCRKYGKIKRFIHVSTDQVYGESINVVDEMPKTEHSLLCPTNPYAATKAGAELIAQSYYYSYNMPIIITRGNYVYGPNQYPEKLIPHFINLLQEDKKVSIHGNGTVVRAFLHVYDTASAFETILEKGTIGEIYNIGCDEKMEYSVLDVAKMLIKQIKHTENVDEWIEYVQDRPFNDQRYYISNHKLKELGWIITKPFEKGIIQTIYNELYDKYINYNLNKINTIIDENVYEIFVFCSGKCGSSTLHKTFLENGYTSLHEHSNYCWQINNNMKGSIFDVIERSMKKYKKVYIFDSYRTPIERKISGFFQNLEEYTYDYCQLNNITNYKDISIDNLIDIFNNKIYTIDNYQSIDEILCYYNINKPLLFDHNKGYNKFQHNNLVFISLLFANINKWQFQLTEIFEKEIQVTKDNISEIKWYSEIYKEFLKNYKISPTLYLNITNNNNFKYYNNSNKLCFNSPFG
jgi:dTDP-glucose 4,6-dehydratase